MAAENTADAAAAGKSGNRKRRLFLYCGLPLLVLLALVLLAAGAVGFAVGTKPGLQAVAWLANNLGGEMLALEGAEGSLASGFTLRGLRFAGGGTEIRLEEVKLDWQPTALIHKKLPVRDLEVKGLHLHLPESEETEEETTSAEPVKMPAISLAVAIRAERARLADFRIFSGKEEVFDLAAAEVDGLEAENENVAFERLAAKNGWMDVTARGKVAMQGDWPLAVELAYGFDFDGYGPIRGKAAVEGDFAKAAIKTATTEPQVVALEGAATDILNELRWQATATSPELALNAINGDWPELQFDAVTIRGTGDIRSYDLDVTGNMGTPYTRRPLALAGKTRIGWDGLEVPALRVSDSAAGGGHLDLVGKLDWSPQLAWDATVDLDKVNPDLAHEELPGALSGRITSKGAWPDDGVEAALGLSGIEGELRGYPVTAEGELAYGGGKLSLPGLRAAVGRNSVAARGEMADAYALDLHLDAPDLKELLPELDGNLTAEGRLAGAKTAPEINLDLRGEGLAYAENRIGRLEGRVRGAFSETGALEADIRAESIALGATPIDALEARLQGNMANHTLRLSAQAPEDQSAGLELAGKLADGAWSGELRQVHLAHPLAGAWAQTQAAKLAASAQAAKLEPLCLRQEGAELCLNGGWQAEGGDWQGAADIKNFPLAQVQKYLPPDLKLGGNLNLTATAQGRAAQLNDASVNLATPGLRLDFLHGETAGQSLVWEAHELAASYRGERLLADWRHALADGSSLAVNLEAPKLPLSGDRMQAPISGRLHLDFKKLDFLTALTRQQSRWSGAFKGDVAVSGSLGKPTLSGNLGLEGGEVLAPELGLHIAPLTLAVGGEAGRIDATVSARSEGGELKAAGGIDLSGDKLAILPLTVRGENFRVMNQPGMAVEISPDLRVDFSDERIAVTGTVRIPMARIEDPSFESGISPSSDVVVMEDRKEGEEKGASLPLHLKVRIETGDRVILDAYGLRARVGGHLDLAQEAGGQLSGNGRLNIEQGSFSIYGKRVKINTGRLLFSGGAMTNPGVDIHSENTENNLTAGMRVSGFLKTPKVELYSRPFRQQTEIISHLVEDTSAIAGGSREDVGLLGDTAEMLGMGGLVPYLEGIKKLSMIDDIRLDTKDDQASLVFGSWITPDFYVSYGKSLAGEESTFKTRYTLGKGFVVETESGETQSSGDIKYEFER